jgi:ribonuclease HI
MEINVYTDGACENNGKINAKAGFGVYFSENDPRNYSEKIQGKQTNNIAELSAIIKASEILHKEIEAGNIINLYTDSQYAMRCCTTYGEKLDKKGWISKKPIPNLELVKKAYSIFKNSPNVRFHYIKAHTGATDEHSLGNEGADRMANLGIGLTECPYAKKTKKVIKKKSLDNKTYLNLPYDEKEEGKKLGTRWDPKKKKWYILNNLEESKKKIILNRWG